MMLGQAQATTEVIRFRCGEREQCGAVRQVVPAFLARWLWRTWQVIARAISDSPSVAIPSRTRRRWRRRLRTSARALVVLLAETDQSLSYSWTELGSVVGLQ